MKTARRNDGPHPLPRERWEYLVLEQSTLSGPFIADHYGDEGWELVAAVRVTETVDRLWFKRAKGIGPPKPRRPAVLQSSEGKTDG